MTGGARDVLRVLAVTADPSAVATIERAVRAEGDEFAVASEVADAMAIAAEKAPHVAFIDLTTDGGAGLALVHHLPAIAPEIALYVTAPASQIELATQAVALGAAGMFVAPISGDDVISAMINVRERRATAARLRELEREVASSRRRSDMLDRIVGLARGGGDSEAVRAIAETLAETCGAKGVALYATFGGGGGECVRLAATGTLRELPPLGHTVELHATIADRNLRELPLEASHGVLGLVLVDGVGADRERDLASMVDVAAAVLALVDRRERDASALEEGKSRVYTSAYFQDVAARDIEKAKRHDRRASIAVIVIDDGATPRRAPASARDGSGNASNATTIHAPASTPDTSRDRERARSELADIVLSVVRDTDVVAATGNRDLAVLLPETGALGANICRRRLLIRAEGDRRAKTTSNDRRGPISARPSRGLPLAIGVSTFPHDGSDVDRLVRVARRRALDQARSSVHALALATMPLGEIVDTLLARPMVDAGLSSPYPLELAMPALLALASSACVEARRGGTATVTVTTQSGMGLLSAARQATSDSGEVTLRVVDVRSIPSCGDLEAIVVAAEHGTWACCGRVNRERFRGVHAADPLLADLIAQRLAQAGGLRFG